MALGTAAVSSPSVPPDLELLAEQIRHNNLYAESAFRAATARGIRTLITHRLAGDGGVMLWLIECSETRSTRCTKVR